MLEFLRKHQYGLMLVVAILTIIAFVFLYDKNTYGSNAAQRGTAFTVYGKGYDANELQKLDNYYQVAARDLGMSDLAQSLQGKRLFGSVPVEFPMNLIILRKKGREMGISPSNEQVEMELKSLRAFSSPTGQFDPAIFDQVTSNLASRGFVQTDLMQLTRDKITLDRLKELLVANFQAPSTEIADKYAEANEEVTAYAITRSLEEFEKTVTVTDEEIKQRYEDTKEQMLSDEQRKIEYVHLKAPEFPKPVSQYPKTPRPAAGTGLNIDPLGGASGVDDISLTGKKNDTTPAPVEPATEEDPAPETETPAAEGDCGSPQDEGVVEDAVEEVKEAADEVKDAVEEAAEGAKSLAEEVADKVKAEVGEIKPTELKPAVAAAKPLSLAEKDEINTDFKRLMKEMIENAPKNDGQIDLAKLAADFAAKSQGKLYGADHGSTELFTAAEPPEFLKNARGSSAQTGPIQYIFAAVEGKTSKALRIRVAGREDWFMFRVTEVVPAKPLSLEESKEKITETLKQEKAVEALEEALKADAEKIAAEMNLEAETGEKKSFKEAADKLGIKYTRHYKFVGQPKQEELMGSTFYGYKDLIQKTVPGAFSEPSQQGDKRHLVYVAAKELKEDDPGTDSKKIAVGDQLIDGVRHPYYGLIEPGYSDRIFRAWLERAYKEAEPERDSERD